MDIVQEVRSHLHNVEESAKFKPSASSKQLNYNAAGSNDNSPSKANGNTPSKVGPSNHVTSIHKPCLQTKLHLSVTSSSSLISTASSRDVERPCSPVFSTPYRANRDRNIKTESVKSLENGFMLKSTSNISSRKTSSPNTFVRQPPTAAQTSVSGGNGSNFGGRGFESFAVNIDFCVPSNKHAADDFMDDDEFDNWQEIERDIQAEESNNISRRDNDSISSNGDGIPRNDSLPICGESFYDSPSTSSVIPPQLKKFAFSSKGKTPTSAASTSTPSTSEAYSSGSKGAVIAGSGRPVLSKLTTQMTARASPMIFPTYNGGGARPKVSSVTNRRAEGEEDTEAGRYMYNESFGEASNEFVSTFV